ncbi:hypothetical protein B9Z55_021007 [Caenorhabditis nigoni]|uniref:GH18 domain-containing protein n=1 Tax=Caenorhabditis nigoni TaxID=1611254 RepID=A0A2G5TQ83_9PELO|nr:hypothetical protein B9Z55_021007 [Caenorhabditis nigoni]
MINYVEFINVFSMDFYGHSVETGPSAPVYDGLREKKTFSMWITLRRKASWDEATRSSYFLNEEERWISIFEDKKSVEAKLDYVNSKNLGGIWISDVDMDDGSINLLDSIDFGGYCASENDNAVKYQC